MYCSECGVELLERAIVCPSCGCPTRNHKSNDKSDGEVGAPAIAALYMLGFVIPVFGLVGAIYLLVKGRVGNALGIGAVSIFAAFFWFGVFNSY